MAPTLHSAIVLSAGDDWVIPGTLLDINNAPIDLTNATFTWGLVGNDGVEVILPSTELVKVSPYTSGKIQIRIARSETAALAGGYYYDALRLTLDDSVQMMWEGLIEVKSDPYGV